MGFLGRICAVACVLLGAQVAAKKGWKIKGMAFSTGHDVDSLRKPYAQKSLDLLKTTDVNYIHVSAYGKMANILSMSYWMQTDDESIRYQIRMHKRSGLRVFFKPVLEVKGTVWRGFIPGRDMFLYRAYLPFITHMARIATEEKVDLLAIGSEYVKTVGNDEAWRWVINRTRAIYPGPITYVANHDNYFNVKFWDAVDVISISGYFVLLGRDQGETYGWSPNMTLTKELWKGKAQEVEDWRAKEGYWGKKVLIAEVGAQSKGEGVVYRKPYDWHTPASVNNWEQAKMYEGILTSFMPKPWCLGIIFWNWEIHPSANLWPPGKSGYTPQGKFAMKIMKLHFAKW